MKFKTGDKIHRDPRHGGVSSNYGIIKEINDDGSALLDFFSKTTNELMYLRYPINLSFYEKYGNKRQHHPLTNIFRDV